MRKEFTDSGINGNFTGYVEVKLNYRTSLQNVHNASTHDEEVRNIKYHIVRGYAGGEEFFSKEFRDENLVWKFIEDIEKKVKSKLHILAKVLKTQTLTEQLNAKGYK